MCRRKESKGGVGDEKKKKGKVTSVLPHSTATAATCLSILFSTLSLASPPLSSPLVFRSSLPLLVFSFLSFTILTSEARKEIRVASWHRLSVHFTRFAVGAITYEFPLSSRASFLSSRSSCSHFPLFLPPFTLSFVCLSFSQGIVLSYTLKNRTHFSSTLIEFSPLGRSSLPRQVSSFAFS